MLSLYSSLSFQNNYLGKFLWGCCFGVFVGFYVTCVVTAGDLFFPKRENVKHSVLQSSTIREILPGNVVSHTKNTCLRNFLFFFIIAALLIFQSEAVPGSERKKGKASMEEVVLREGMVLEPTLAQECTAVQLSWGLVLG